MSHPGLDPERERQLAQVCASCGHERRWHYANGPCLMVQPGREGSVCPCLRFTESS